MFAFRRLRSSFREFSFRFGSCVELRAISLCLVAGCVLSYCELFVSSAYGISKISVS